MHPPVLSSPHLGTPQEATAIWNILTCAAPAHDGGGGEKMENF
jgi:hypothetical protein